MSCPWNRRIHVALRYMHNYTHTSAWFLAFATLDLQRINLRLLVTNTLRNTYTYHTFKFYIGFTSFRSLTFTITSYFPDVFCKLSCSLYEERMLLHYMHNYNHLDFLLCYFRHSNAEISLVTFMSLNFLQLLTCYISATDSVFCTLRMSFVNVLLIV